MTIVIQQMTLNDVILYKGWEGERRNGIYISSMDAYGGTWLSCLLALSERGNKQGREEFPTRRKNFLCILYSWLAFL